MVIKKVAPPYSNTLDVIKEAKLDDYEGVTESLAKQQQFQAFTLATPRLTPMDREILFSIIWNTARVVGHMETLRSIAKEKEKRETDQELTRLMIEHQRNPGREVN